MEKEIVFNNPPKAVKAYVEHWLAHMRKHGGHARSHIMVMEDILRLIEVALSVLAPQPTQNPQPENTEKDE